MKLIKKKHGETLELSKEEWAEIGTLAGWPENDRGEICLDVIESINRPLSDDEIELAIEKGEKEIAKKPLTRDVKELVEEMKKNMP